MRALRISETTVQPITENRCLGTHPTAADVTISDPFHSHKEFFHWESRLTIRDTSLDSLRVNTWELMFRSQNEP